MNAGNIIRYSVTNAISLVKFKIKKKDFQSMHQSHIIYSNRQGKLNMGLIKIYLPFFTKPKMMSNLDTVFAVTTVHVFLAHGFRFYLTQENLSRHSYMFTS